MLLCNTKETAMKNAQFGVTFFMSSQRQDACGTNGLPLTPNSIRILGRSQYLKSLSFENIAQYVDIIRGKHERIIMVVEYYRRNLKTLLKEAKLNEDHESILRLSKDILQGLWYLNKNGIVCRNLCLENILITGEDRAKIFNFGLYYITNNGKYVTFPIGNPKYTAPEVFLSGTRKGPCIPSCDIWSLGIILTELVLGEELWPDLKLSQIIRKVSSLTHCENGVLERLFQEHHATHLLKDMHPRLKKLIEQCLDIDPVSRGTPAAVIETVFDSTGEPLTSFLTTQVTVDLETLGRAIDDIRNSSTDSKDSLGHLTKRNLKQVYYLWQLAGGDVFVELKRQGLTRKKPSVLSLPRSMTLEGESEGSSKERGLLLDNTVIILPLLELQKRLSSIPAEAYYPLIASKSRILKLPDVVSEAKQLPLIIREKDIEYQFHRILLFDRLLKGYPYTKSRIHQEALVDIPPFYRAQIWSCLLEIEGDVQGLYNSIDKETPTSTDRQIEVDIPRCHQYDELLSSPSGHEKFKRVLKAWVVSNTEYVYWQGLDSLSAPFLYLNFNNEAMAFSCLSAFIPKYLYNFFLKDNSMVIQEYLSKFSQLIAFHDPELTNHLDSIGFIPELYAIPWFLTMFSHVFPLHKIFHLWDKLLLGDSSFSLCIGLAILYQLRESLLSSGFNECILLFSDMPEINIERCVKDSVEIYCSTPKSALYRKHEPPVKVKGEKLRKISVTSDQLNFNGFHNGDNSSNNSSNDGLKMEAISLSDLKKEKCARISGEDFLYLLDLNKTRFPKPKVLVIDVRNHEDYNRGTIPSSISMPYSSSFTPEGSLVPTAEANILNANRGKIIAVVGNRGDSAVKFAEALLRLEFPRICVLHRGIDIFRPRNILVVPSVL